MGKYFEDKFNGKDEDSCDCVDCRGYSDEDINVEEMIAEIEIQNPEDIIGNHFELILDADNEEEIYTYLTSLFYSGYINGKKLELLDDIQFKMDILNDLQNGTR